MNRLRTCPACGYNLSGLSGYEVSCPECGNAAGVPVVIEILRKRKRRLKRLLVLAMILWPLVYVAIMLVGSASAPGVRVVTPGQPQWHPLLVNTVCIVSFVSHLVITVAALQMLFERRGNAWIRGTAIVVDTALIVVLYPCLTVFAIEVALTRWF